MITIGNAIIGNNNGRKGVVTLAWTDEEKSAKCDCGYSWTPTGINDQVCKKCNPDLEGK